MKTYFIPLAEFVQRCGSQQQAALLLKSTQPDVNKHLKRGNNVQVEIIMGTNMPIYAEKRVPFGGLTRLTEDADAA